MYWGFDTIQFQKFTRIYTNFQKKNNLLFGLKTSCRHILLNRTIHNKKSSVKTIRILF